MKLTSKEKDVSDGFEGIVEVDETYFGGQKKNKNTSQLRKEKEVFGKESKKEKGRTKQPIFGILCRSGKVFAELVDDTEAKDFVPIITRKVKAGTQTCSDTYRFCLEGFWGFLKRKLASKGGARIMYLPFFLGEYVWRYNHRKEKLIDQRSRLIGLITSQFGARY